MNLVRFIYFSDLAKLFHIQYFLSPPPFRFTHQVTLSAWMGHSLRTLHTTSCLDQPPSPLRPTAILAGFNSQEGTASVRSYFPEYTTSETGPPISQGMFVSMVTDTLLGQDRNSLIRDSVSQEYVDWSRADYSDLDYFDAYVDYYSDYIWRSGSDATMRRYYELGVTNLYQYLFTHTPSRLVNLR